MGLGPWAGSTTNAPEGGRHAEGDGGEKEQHARTLLMTVNLLRSVPESQWMGLEYTTPALCAGQGSKLGDFICFQSFDDDYADFRPKFKIWIGGWPPSSAKGSMTAILLSPVQR